MKRLNAAVLVSVLGLAGCGKAGSSEGKGPPVEVLGVAWEVGADCAPPRIVVDVNTTGNAQIELNGRRTGEDGLLAVQSHVVMASDHIPETATELVVQAVDRGAKGPAVTVPLPPRPRTGLRLRGASNDSLPVAALTCGQDDKATSDVYLVSLDHQRTLTTGFTACGVVSGSLEGGTLTVPQPGRFDLKTDVAREVEAATLRDDFPLARKVTLVDRPA